VEHVLASPECEHMKRTVGYLKKKEIIEYFGNILQSSDAEIKGTVGMEHRIKR